jgi:DUF1009 family protein
MLLRALLKVLSIFLPKRLPTSKPYPDLLFDIPPQSSIGLIAGNGQFPIMFAKRAKALGHSLYSVCHLNETDEELLSYSEDKIWIKLGELGRILDFFQNSNVQYVALAGGISRIKHFGDVKLDVKGSLLIMRLRSTKDDVVMRGIAEEVEALGIKVIPCTALSPELITEEGILSGGTLSSEEQDDVEVGIRAIRAMSGEDIGQTVVVREGIVIAVEAAEGTNRAIQRGGDLAKGKLVVVKCAKPTQDMRFDVPTAGPETIRICKESGVSVLALEAGRSIIMDKGQFFKDAVESGIRVVGIPSLVN